MVDMLFHSFRSDLEEMRTRLIANPKDDLDDLMRRIERDRENEMNSYKARTLERIIVKGLFHGDYKSARLAMAKCVMFQPQKELSDEEGAELLQALWQSMMTAGYQDDMKELMERISRIVKLEDGDY